MSYNLYIFSSPDLFLGMCALASGAGQFTPICILYKSYRYCLNPGRCALAEKSGNGKVMHFIMWHVKEGDPVFIGR